MGTDQDLKSAENEAIKEDNVHTKGELAFSLVDIQDLDEDESREYMPSDIVSPIRCWLAHFSKAS